MFSAAQSMYFSLTRLCKCGGEGYDLGRSCARKKVTLIRSLRGSAIILRSLNYSSIVSFIGIYSVIPEAKNLLRFEYPRSFSLTVVLLVYCIAALV